MHTNLTNSSNIPNAGGYKQQSKHHAGIHGPIGNMGLHKNQSHDASGNFLAKESNSTRNSLGIGSGILQIRG